MTWVRIDDAFPDHPKIAGLSDAAFRAYVTGLCYCGKYLTNGVIPAPLAARFAGKRSVMQELTDALLWIRMDPDIAVNDYLEYNPTKEQVSAERKASRERQAKSRRDRAVTPTEHTPDISPTSAEHRREFDSPVPVPLPEELQDLPAASPRIDISDPDQAFLLGRLRGRFEAFEDDELTAAAVEKLNRAWTQQIVTGVLRELWGFPPDDVADAYGLLLVMCRDRAKGQASA